MRLDRRPCIRLSTLFSSKDHHKFSSQIKFHIVVGTISVQMFLFSQLEFKCTGRVDKGVQRKDVMKRRARNAITAYDISY